MGTVHQLIELRGREAAGEEADRASVEAALAYMGDEDNAVGFLYSGFTQAALPHRKLPNEQGWQVEGDRFCLIVEPGMRRGPSGPVHVGVPYGSRARLILIYLQSEALRTSSREVILGRSLRSWLERMRIPVGGKNLSIVREQTERLSRCRLTFEVRQGSRIGLKNQNIMDSAIFLEAEEEGGTQGSLFAQTARLSEAFYEGLRRHPVPIEEAAVAAIANNSMAIDIYVWLAFRLHSLTKPTSVSWHAVKAQFGAGFSAMNNFRRVFSSNLRLALAVYPAAQVDPDGKGLILHPSRPPVAPRQLASNG